MRKQGKRQKDRDNKTGTSDKRKQFWTPSWTK